MASSSSSFYQEIESVSVYMDTSVLPEDFSLDMDASFLIEIFSVTVSDPQPESRKLEKSYARDETIHPFLRIYDRFIKYGPCTLKCEQVWGEPPSVFCEHCLCYFHTECISVPAYLNVTRALCLDCSSYINLMPQEMKETCLKSYRENLKFGKFLKFTDTEIDFVNNILHFMLVPEEKEVEDKKTKRRYNRKRKVAEEETTAIPLLIPAPTPAQAHPLPPRIIETPTQNDPSKIFDLDSVLMPPPAPVISTPIPVISTPETKRRCRVRRNFRLKIQPQSIVTIGGKEFVVVPKSTKVKLRKSTGKLKTVQGGLKRVSKVTNSLIKRKRRVITNLTMGRETIITYVGQQNNNEEEPRPGPSGSRNAPASANPAPSTPAPPVSVPSTLPLPTTTEQATIPIYTSGGASSNTQQNAPFELTPTNSSNSIYQFSSLPTQPPLIQRMILNGQTSMVVNSAVPATSKKIEQPAPDIDNSQTKGTSKCLKKSEAPQPDSTGIAYTAATPSSSPKKQRQSSKKEDAPVPPAQFPEPTNDGNFLVPNSQPEKKKRGRKQSLPQNNLNKLSTPTLQNNNQFTMVPNNFGDVSNREGIQANQPQVRRNVALPQDQPNFENQVQAQSAPLRNVPTTSRGRSQTTSTHNPRVVDGQEDQFARLLNSPHPPTLRALMALNREYLDMPLQGLASFMEIVRINQQFLEMALAYNTQQCQLINFLIKLHRRTSASLASSSDGNVPTEILEEMERFLILYEQQFPIEGNNDQNLNSPQGSRSQHPSSSQGQPIATTSSNANQHIQQRGPLPQLPRQQLDYQQSSLPVAGDYAHMHQPIPTQRPNSVHPPRAQPSTFSNAQYEMPPQSQLSLPNANLQSQLPTANEITPNLKVLMQQQKEKENFRFQDSYGNSSSNRTQGQQPASNFGLNHSGENQGNYNGQLCACSTCSTARSIAKNSKNDVSQMCGVQAITRPTNSQITTNQRIQQYSQHQQATAQAARIQPGNSAHGGMYANPVPLSAQQLSYYSTQQNFLYQNSQQAQNQFRTPTQPISQNSGHPFNRTGENNQMMTSYPTGYPYSHLEDRNNGGNSSASSANAIRKTNMDYQLQEFNSQQMNRNRNEGSSAQARGLNTQSIEESLNTQQINQRAVLEPNFNQQMQYRHTATPRPPPDQPMSSRQARMIAAPYPQQRMADHYYGTFEQTAQQQRTSTPQHIINSRAQQASSLHGGVQAATSRTRVQPLPQTEQSSSQQSGKKATKSRKPLSENEQGSSQCGGMQAAKSRKPLPPTEQAGSQFDAVQVRKSRKTLSKTQQGAQPGEIQVVNSQNLAPPLPQIEQSQIVQPVSRPRPPPTPNNISMPDYERRMDAHPFNVVQALTEMATMRQRTEFEANMIRSGKYGNNDSNGRLPPNQNMLGPLYLEHPHMINNEDQHRNVNSEVSAPQRVPELVSLLRTRNVGTSVQRPETRDIHSQSIQENHEADDDVVFLEMVASSQRTERNRQTSQARHNANNMKREFQDDSPHGKPDDDNNNN